MGATLECWMQGLHPQVQDPQGMQSLLGLLESPYPLEQPRGHHHAEIFRVSPKFSSFFCPSSQGSSQQVVPTAWCSIQSLSLCLSLGHWD